MVQIDVPAAFCVSMLAVDLGRNVLKNASDKAGQLKTMEYYRYLVRSLFFAGFVVAPAGIYLLAGWPGWEQIYWHKLVEDVKMTGWQNALYFAGFIMAIVGGAYLGHALACRWLHNGKEKYIRPTYLGLVAVVSIVVLSTYPSFTLMGTYDQYHNLNGQSRSAMAAVTSNPYGFSVAWTGVMVYFVAGFLALILSIRKDKKALS